MWEIQDNNGTIHSGSETSMSAIFQAMTNQEDLSVKEKQTYESYFTDWEGDLKLVQIHNIYR